MGLMIYWELCKKYGGKVSSEKWYEECADEVRKSECRDYGDMIRYCTNA